MKFFNFFFFKDSRKQVLKKIHESAQQAYNKGYVFLKMQMFEECIGACDVAEKLWHEEADMLISQGDYETAKRSKINLINTLSCKSYANYMLGRYDTSIELLDKILEMFPDDPESIFRKGFVLYKSKRYDEALSFLENALAICKEFPEAWYCKGSVLRELENYDAALEAFDNSISYSKPLNYKFPRFAWISLTSSSKIKIDSAEAWYCKGEIFFRQKKYEKALEAFSKALEIKPEFIDAVKFRDIVLQQLDKDRISN
ncbi:MAG: tetratricopeptide repeat protein [Methanomethylovorans sp.]|jgi:tetratricopeptide (TPR) repeat protein|nr:tetratricopeptide repeat protein [Methanomethylovorans sp.]